VPWRITRTSDRLRAGQHGRIARRTGRAAPSSGDSCLAFSAAIAARMRTPRTFAIAHSLSMEPDMPAPSEVAALDIDAEIRFSLARDDLFGKNDDELKIRIPTSLKDALMRAAAAKRMPVAAYLRILIASTVLGHEHVASVLAKRLMLDPIRVSTTVDSDERGGW
jgi:hypothetical protein